jgi:hypothetical protein
LNDNQSLMQSVVKGWSWAVVMMKSGKKIRSHCYSGDTCKALGTEMDVDAEAVAGCWSRMGYEEQVPKNIMKKTFS